MLKIGICGWQNARDRWKKGVGAVELTQMAHAVPKTGVLARWRAEAPQTFDFIPTVPKALTAPESGGPLTRAFWPIQPALDLWERVRVAAETLEAGAVLVATPHSFTPTEPNRTALSEFFERCRRENFRVVWKPTGLWTEEDVAVIRTDLGLEGCVDPLVQPPEQLRKRKWIYGRVESLGLGSRPLDQDDVRLLAQICAEVASGYCVLHTADPHRDARRLAEEIRRVTKANL
jgi:uncharacterized protein YecE (DUF72 family)